MRDNTIESIYELIDENIPEFKGYKDYSMWYRENPYLHTGNFGQFLVEKIEKQETTTVKKIFDFINRVFEDQMIDESVKNMIHIQVFEILPGSNQMIKISREYLKGSALFSFNGVLGEFVPKE